jgi:hypothetical protein
VARAVVAEVPKLRDGSFDVPHLAEWLAFTAAEYMVREGVA